MINAGFTEGLLAMLAVILVYAAIVDVRTMTISNGLNATVALMAPLYWWSVGLPLWPDAAIQVGVAMLVFAILAATFYMGMMGGGDVKLAAALALWFRPVTTLHFLVIMSIAGGILTLIVLAIHKKRGKQAPKEELLGEEPAARPEVPYGVAIAAGMLWILAQRFLNQFA
jgi:prepilin peptidase CpaA